MYLKTAALQACLDACPKGRRTQENMKALGTMLFRYAMCDDVVSKNYAELLRVGGETQAGREPFTDEELEKIRRHSAKDRACAHPVLHRLPA